MAQEELARITHIVRQTLGFYREATRPVRLRISDVMKSVLDLYQRRIEQKKISIKTDFSGESSILGFPGEMRQVFSNLIANALDALPAAGRIHLRVHQARNVHGTHELGVLCRVYDNGDGIRRHADGDPGLRSGRPGELHHPDAERPRRQPDVRWRELRHALRDVRRQGLSAQAESQRGTGLGLWVTYGIVTKHGGWIRVRSSSRLGRSGTMFLIFLPAEPAELLSRDQATNQQITA